MQYVLRMSRLLAVMILVQFASAAHAEQPNIVVILVDDAAWMDFGSFGGEARTQNIDALSKNGVSFSNYHTSPMCAPSRAMLLTGLNSHKTGVGALPEILTDEQRGSPAYSQRFLPGVKTIAGQLRAGGYQTFMAGKWHLGEGPGDLPNDHGFDRSFALAASGADNWEQKSFMPFYSEAPWYEDGKPATLPDDFYSSKFLIDKMIEYLKARDDSKPFFAYLPFQAIHIPVQAPREFTDRYEGVYSAGWDVVRTQRFKRAKELGLIPQNANPPLIPAALRKWANLSADDQAHYERRMMVNAGMLDAMDHHIGRLMTYLRSTGQYDNTIFVVTSDNGPESGEPNLSEDFQDWMKINDYNDDFETLGEKGSNFGIGAEWASAAAGPSHLFKTYASEGGTRVPLIIAGPGISAQTFNGARSYVTDIAPTLTELAGMANGKVDGRSLVPILNGKSKEVYGEQDSVAFEVGGNSSVFKGRFKLTRNTLPFGDAEWRLYDIESDPSETRDLSVQYPELRATMLADYERYADANGVIALPKDFNVYDQVNSNTQAKVLQRYLPYLIGIGLVVLAVILLIVIVIVRRRSSQN